METQEGFHDAMAYDNEQGFKRGGNEARILGWKNVSARGSRKSHIDLKNAE